MSYFLSKIENKILTKLLKIPRRTLVVPHVDLRQFYRQVRRVSKTARRRLGGEEWTSVRVRFL